jgi:sRNA-binding protein
MSESTITQPVYEPQEPQPPVSKKFVYAGVAVGAVALALGGAALGISLSQPHVSPAQAQAYANSAASAAKAQAVAQASRNNAAAVSSLSGLKAQITNLSQQKLPQMGVCFNYNTQSSSDGSSTWVTDVEVTAPTNTNGVLSCTTGDFVSLTPTVPAHN